MPRDPRDLEFEDRVRIEHMLLAAREAVGFVQGRREEDLNQDRMLVRALVNAIQEVGEAARCVSDPARTRVPAVDWPRIVGMRHKLIHVYWGVRLDILWATVSFDLPALIGAMEQGTRDWPLPPDDAEPT